jgi:hypothetical protein
MIRFSGSVAIMVDDEGMVHVRAWRVGHDAARAAKSEQAPLCPGLSPSTAVSLKRYIIND